MDFYKFWMVSLIVLQLKFVYCESDDTGKNTDQQTEIGTDQQVKKFRFLAITEPERLMVWMERSLVAFLNYTVACNDQKELYTIELESTDRDVFVLRGNTTFKVDCKDATEVDPILKDENVSKNIDSVQYSMKNSQNFTFLAVTGSVRLDIYGILLGMAELDVRLTQNEVNFVADVTESTNISDVIEERIPVAVLRVLRPIDSAFRIIVACVIAMVIMGFGCGLNLEVVKECLKKPIAPGIGLGCQYILMPLIGFTVAKLVPISNKAVTFGIFVCGVCPGGGASNIYSYLLGGDVDLSITMTLISTVAALAMMPLWIYTLGRQFIGQDFQVFIPYANMAQTLAMLTIPLAIGVFIKKKYPKAAITFVKILKPVTIIIMIIFVSVGIYSNLYIFKLFRLEYLLAGALLPYCGFLAGGVIAAILRQPWTRVKTIALETGMQNVGVAFFMMVMSFPPPQGDLAAMAPAALGMMTPIPPLLVTIPYLIYKRCTRTYDVVPALTDGEVKVTKDGEIQTMEGKDSEIVSEKKRLASDDEENPMIEPKTQ